MALFNFKKKNQSKVTIEMYGYENGKRVELKAEKNPDPPKPASYFKTIEQEIKPIESRMVGFAVSLNEPRKTDDKIAILRNLISAYNELEQKCLSLGVEYKEYFSKSWEHCHNSRSKDFRYVDRFKEELKQLQENHDDLVAQETRRESALIGLEDKVISILKNNPSILQTDVYNQFDPTVKSDIQGILYFMEKNGTISRTKSGRTYEIKYL